MKKLMRKREKEKDREKVNETAKEKDHQPVEPWNLGSRFESYNRADLIKLSIINCTMSWNKLECLSIAETAVLV